MADVLSIEVPLRDANGHVVPLSTLLANSQVQVAGTPPSDVRPAQNKLELRFFKDLCNAVPTFRLCALTPPSMCGGIEVPALVSFDGVPFGIGLFVDPVIEPRFSNDRLAAMQWDILLPLLLAEIRKAALLVKVAFAHNRYIDVVNGDDFSPLMDGENGFAPVLSDHECLFSRMPNMAWSTVFEFGVDVLLEASAWMVKIVEAWQNATGAAANVEELPKCVLLFQFASFLESLRNFAHHDGKFELLKKNSPEDLEYAGLCIGLNSFLGRVLAPAPVSLF